MKIGVVGDEDFVLGFRLAGVDKAYVSEGDSRQAFRRAVEDDEIGIIVIHEKDYSKFPPATIKAMEKASRPIVITISETEGESNIREMIRRCIGVDLWK